MHNESKISLNVTHGINQIISPLELNEVGPNEGRDEEREHESSDGSVCPHGSPPDFGQQGLCKSNQVDHGDMVGWWHDNVRIRHKLLPGHHHEQKSI